MGEGPAKGVLRRAIQGGNLSIVMAGLDPAIHVLKGFFLLDGCAGQARA
jgi:hypothetical protein